MSAVEPDPDIANDPAWWKSECDALRIHARMLVTDLAAVMVERDEARADAVELRKRCHDLMTQLAERRNGDDRREPGVHVAAPLADDLLVMGGRLRAPNAALRAALDYTRSDPDNVLDAVRRLNAHASHQNAHRYGTIASWFADVSVIAAFDRLAAVAGPT